MIVSSLFFCITTICFLREFKLGKNEGYIQRFYYYVGGYGGGLFFLYMFLSGMYGEVSHISVKFVTFLLFIFLGNSRMDFFYKQKYYGLKINSEISLSEINITGNFPIYSSQIFLFFFIYSPSNNDSSVPISKK